MAVAAPRTTLATGDTLRFTATARDSLGRDVTSARFAWSVVHPALAEVDTGGLVRALRPGSIEVRATAVGPAESVRGAVSGSATVTARQLVTTLRLVGPDTIVTGDTARINAIAYDGIGEPMPQVTFAWSSSDTVPATVDPDGRLVGRALGSTAIKVRAVGPAEAIDVPRTAERTVSVRLVLTQLAGGSYHNCGVARGGVVHCWGEAAWGRLGTGVSYEPWKSVPAPVPTLINARFVSVVGDRQSDSRSGHTCALSMTGVAYCWGSGAWGMLGDGKFGHHSNPVPTPLPGIGIARQVGIGGQHTCVLAVDGSAHCAGGNTFAQVGVDPTTGMCADEPCVTRLTAVQGGHTFVAITAGGNHNCGLTAAGEALCWGDNSTGGLGTSTEMGSHSATPRRAGTLQFASVSAGASYTCGLDPQGAAYCWGFNYAGQLGNGESWNGPGPDTPTPVVTNERFSSIYAGQYHSCALTAEGAAYCWGSNEWGRLGTATSDVCGGGALDSFTCATKPQPVSTQLRFVSLALGVEHTCGLTATGRAYCWGRNGRGQLGDGTTVDRLAPVAVRELP